MRHTARKKVKVRPDLEKNFEAINLSKHIIVSILHNLDLSLCLFPVPNLHPYSTQTLNNTLKVSVLSLEIWPDHSLF